MSSKIEFKCSKCGGKRFLVKVWLEVSLEVDSTTGKIKYEWIDDVKCANLACDQEPSKELKMLLAEKAKSIISALRKEKLEVSISG
jgi:hypothetical protein